MHWVERYVGLPWRAGGQGPSDFDCWGFVRHVNREVFGRELPEFVVDASNLRACMNAFGNGVDARWEQTQTPADGDVALFSSGKYASHCGIFARLGPATTAVAHCERTCGVVVASVDRLPWSRHDFYRWIGP
jgi:cell wall-associated NlpC family hydrolase